MVNTSDKALGDHLTEAMPEMLNNDIVDFQITK